LLFAVILLTGSLITSCEKEQQLKDKETSSRGSEEPQYLTPSCDDYCAECNEGHCNPRNVLEAITIPNDTPNNRANMILYHYAYAVKEAAKDAAMRQYMVSAMSSGSQKITPFLLTLAQNNSTFGSFLNTKIKESISNNNVYPKGVEPGISTLLATTSWDANTYLQQKLVYAGATFDPVIHYITAPNTNSTSQPATVLIGQEVNDCDDVAGWKGDAEVLVGETEANSGDRAVFIVDPGAGGAVQYLQTPETGMEEATQDRTTTVNMASIQIMGEAYRYENNGKSEVKGGYVKFTSAPFSIDATNNQVFYKKITCSQLKNMTIVGNTNTMVSGGFDGSSHFFGFFEYDWYASSWTINNLCV
jgi:hypothetical protein